MAKQPETRNGFSLLPIAVPEGHRVETHFTDPFVIVSDKSQTVSWSKPSNPNTWDADAAFGEPQSALFHPIKGWCPPDVAARSLPGSFQELDADNQRAMLENPPRARLTCDKSGLDERANKPHDWNVAEMQALSRQIADLKARIAVLEADNKVLEARKDAVLDQYAAASTAAMRLSHRVLTLQAELDALKRHQSPHLPESEKPSQDAVWRNATRFSR